MLTGLFQPDISLDGSKVCGNASIYGNSIHGGMDQIRLSMGVCPQHDVLFDTLSVREHILLFAQLKGASFAEADAEASYLAKLFHLENRLDNTGEELSGGQKRKLSVAIAVCGGSKFVVLDEPTAGVDVELRRDMWEMVRGLREQGVTIILTTHYIEEAEEMADRIGVINKGEIILVEDKTVLMRKLGKKQLTVHLKEPMAALPTVLDDPHLALANDGADLVYTFDAQAEDTGIADLLRRLADQGIEFKDLKTDQSSLEDIFVSLVRAPQ